MTIRVITTDATPAPNVVLLCLVVVLILSNAWAMWRWRITIKAWGSALDGWEKANALNRRMFEEYESERRASYRRGSSRS